MGSFGFSLLDFVGKMGWRMVAEDSRHKAEERRRKTDKGEISNIEQGMSNDEGQTTEEVRLRAGEVRN